MYLCFVPTDSDDSAKDGDDEQYMLHREHVFIPNSQGGQDSKNGTRYEGHVLGDDREQWRVEGAQVLGGWTIGATQPGVDLVLQLIEMTQVEPSIQRPASHAQSPRLPFHYLQNNTECSIKRIIMLQEHTIQGPCTTHLSIVEKGIEDLPQEDQRGQDEIGNPY